MPSRTRRVALAKVVVALLLTMGAGLIDVAGFLLFWQIFTAHMTGNTAHLAMSLTRGSWLKAAQAGFVIPVFLAGSVMGRCIIEYCTRSKWRRAASLVLLLEAVLLSEIIWLNQGHSSIHVTWASVLLLALVMGLQTAALTRIGPLTVHTTFVTGMLNSLGQRFATLTFWVWDALHDRAKWRDMQHSRDVRESWLLLSVWTAYAAGGILGAVFTPRWRSSVLLLPVVLLFASIVVDQISPLSIEEEEDSARQESALRRAPE